MAIRARVGRHTQLGGRHCQNWSDDQRAVIDLLNRISPPNGGAGGSLYPRIVAGIASAELYNAMVAFENRHFRRPRRGKFAARGWLARTHRRLPGRLRIHGAAARARTRPAASLAAQASRQPAEFAATRYTHHYETALTQMWETWANGHDPVGFAVPPSLPAGRRVPAAPPIERIAARRMSAL